MGKIYIDKKKIQEIQDLMDKKNAINDLCILLASNNDLVAEGNQFYERLLLDNEEYLLIMDKFWDDVKNKYNISLKDDEELYLDFASGEITIRKISC